MSFKQMFATLLIAGCLPSITAADFIKIDPRATYLHKSSNDTGPDPISIDLSGLSFSVTPGTILKLKRIGDYSARSDLPGRTSMIGVFSGSHVLLAPSLLNRVQDAIGAGNDVFTGPTYFGTEPTDIAEDFLISGVDSSSIIIEVPVGATHLFVSPADSFYVDNTDGDANYGIEITTVPFALVRVDGQSVDDGGFVEIPCENQDGATVTLDASDSFDPDGDNVDGEWSVGDGIQIVDPMACVTNATFPLGVHTVTLTVYDLDENGERQGTFDTAMVTVVVEDETPPLVMVSTDLAALWPANNKMVPVIICVEASDACSDPGALDVRCCVTSSQPDDSDGTGELVGDVDGADGFTDAVPVKLEYFAEDGVFAAMVGLRAERDGGDKAGRVYSIYVEALDGEGNSGQASTTVVVPHDGRGH